MARAGLQYTNRSDLTAKGSRTGFLTHAPSGVNERPHMPGIRFFLMPLATQEAGSGEIQRAFFVEPHVADQQNPQKHQHGEQRENRKMSREPRAKQDGPGK